MLDLNKEILKGVFNFLDKKNCELNKILVHKVMFFLKESGLPITYRFTPYTYGPFSFDLMNEMNEMVFWDKLETEGNNSFKITSPLDSDIESSLKEKIKAKIEDFFVLIDNDMDFGNLELYGTAIYCLKALQEINDEVNFDDFYEEFTAWKGEGKYPKDNIQKAYSKLENVFH